MNVAIISHTGELHTQSFNAIDCCIYFTKITKQKLVYFVSIPVTSHPIIRLGFPLMCDSLLVECHFSKFRQQLAIYIVGN